MDCRSICQKVRVFGAATRVNQFTAELQKSCVRNLLVSESREYLYPPDSDVDPNMPDHRVRPEMRGPDGQIYPATDFVRTNDGLWVNAVTGQSPQNLVGEPKLTNIASASHRSTPSCGPHAKYNVICVIDIAGSSTGDRGAS
jgi:hypothetical protein